MYHGLKPSDIDRMQPTHYYKHGRVSKTYYFWETVGIT